MTRKSKLLIAAAAGLALLAATPVFAGPGGGCGGPMGSGMGMGMGMMDETFAKALTEKLNLNGDQKALLEAHVAAVKHSKEAMADHWKNTDHQAMQKMTVEQHEAYRQTMWQAKSEDFQKIAQTRELFFNSLNDQQKQMLGPMGGANGMMGHRMGQKL